jgi:hypothetical protein
MMTLEWVLRCEVGFSLVKAISYILDHLQSSDETHEWLVCLHLKLILAISGELFLAPMSIEFFGTFSDS